MPAKPKPPGEISQAFRDDAESVDTLIQNRKKTKGDSTPMSNTNNPSTAIAPNNWLLNNSLDLPGAMDQAPPAAPSGSVFPRPFPLVKMNQRDPKGTRMPFFVCEGAEDREAFLVPGISLRDPATKGKTSPSILRVAPIWAYPRHTLWSNNQMEFEHPTSFGPFEQTGSEGKDEVRVIWYDVDRDAFYFMDVAAQQSRHEAWTFAYYAVNDMARNGTPPYYYVYTMTTIGRDAKSGRYYQLRFQRQGDVISPGYTSLETDSGAPNYDVIDLRTFSTAKNPDAGKQVISRIESRINSATPTLEQAAVHLLGMTGMEAMRWIRKLQNGEASIGDALKAPRGLPGTRDANSAPALPARNTVVEAEADDYYESAGSLLS